MDVLVAAGDPADPLHEVRDIAEAPRLAPVAEDGERLVGEALGDEGGHHAAVPQDVHRHEPAPNVRRFVPQESHGLRGRHSDPQVAHRRRSIGLPLLEGPDVGGVRQVELFAEVEALFESGKVWGIRLANPSMSEILPKLGDIRQGYEKWDQRVEALKAAGVQPGLAFVRVGEDAASKVYVGRKEKMCAEVGVFSETHVLPEGTSEAELLGLLARLNADRRLHGILVQAPLPSHIRATVVYASVRPENFKAMIDAGRRYGACA